MVTFVIPLIRGGVSALTPAQVRQITEGSDVMVSYSVFDAWAAQGVCQRHNQSYLEFCGLESLKLRAVMTLFPAWSGPIPSGPTAEVSVSGEGESGRISVTVKTLMQAAAALRPDILLPLYSATPANEAPSRRSRVAQQRTERWWKECTAATRIPLAAPASLGLDTELVFTDTAGLGEDYGTTAVLQSSAATHSASFVFTSVPALADVVLAALAGCTHIECFYPFQLARRGQMLDTGYVRKILAGTVIIKEEAPSSIVFDLTDKRFQLDMSPPAADCPCYTCRRHTRGYLYHLFSVQEMNGETLLSIHNLTEVVRLCASINAVPLEDRKKRLNAALGFLTFA